ncbi:MAG: 2,3-bisphosphoglycerate-independent phosphoglycerate mutase [Candidatus Nanoarchaeia archaeon]|nr:2,3-bisphosphoglycerate-independent phosphoglycerate mutase [Candidatus Haiyanarchaeum thermophilum]MCW1303336.1 2,3-bisphosphoglycerate-independent phosphoglycerate mutase [Candidatus Haiyanarchaeum thermophilum]MCW1304082.1 2,3-bisphosphoglycerate-independent phosphoglycerate mutase [Candidatus Haiyanarchaeum thermophilum]MCW1306496.1 2,3-bisphosphoglycerate-independent phosphoglycerate mutase [Candidatus Haiyanarchaeum thermophilum]MCW1307552.1 2,3-bisphosphoglycerate-independent phosphog
MDKLVFVIIDGLGDRKCRELYGKTPLEAASKPFLDYFARHGKVGLINVIDPSIAPTSEHGILSLLGYDVIATRFPRGPLEALGIGINVGEELAFRTDFATLRDGIIVDRRAGRIREGVKELERDINQKIYLEDVNFVFKSTIAHRGVLIFYSNKFELSDCISDTDPQAVNVPPNLCKPLILRESEIRTSAIVNEFIRKTHLLLEYHRVNLQRKARGLNEANFLLLRGGGIGLPRVEKISLKYRRFWCCISGSPLEKGIARLVGMEVVDIPEATGDIDTDLRAKARALIERLDEFDCFLIHIKGTDEAGHDGNAELKKEFIEKIDGLFFSELFSNLSLRRTVICVTCDHATPCELGRHSNDPVPVLISGGKIKGDGIDNFSESSCRRGSIRMNGRYLLPMLMELLK